jgi:general secretion pathway protein L
MKSIGIDIGINGIALAEVSVDRAGYEVNRAEFYPVNPNDGDNWELDLLQGLKFLKENFDLENKVVVVGLPQKLVSARNLSFPFSRRMDILRSLPFELDEELPFGSDDSFFDAKTVAQNANETSVLAFATPQKEVMQLVELLARVQIDPDLISTEGAAFANLVEDWQNGSYLQSSPETIPNPLTMRLFVRHDHTLITLFQQRQLVWTRTISWGEKNLILELMKNFNYPYDQAATLIPDHMRLLMIMAGASAQELRLSETIEKSLLDFTQQLRMTLLDFQDRFQGSIGFAQLSGPISRIENINAHLTKNVGIPFNSESIVGDILNPRQVQAVSHMAEQLPIAIGLALEGLKRPKNPAINLRQGESIKRNLFWEKTWNKWGHALTLVAIAYVLYTGYGFIREQVSVGLDDVTYQELQKQAGAIANLRGGQATPENIERYILDEQEKVKNAKIFAKVQDIEPSMKVVNMLSSTLPSNKKSAYDIRKVSVNNSQVSLEGVAEQRNTVDLIRQKLQTMSINNKVRSEKTTLNEGKGVPFAFSFTMKGTL